MGKEKVRLENLNFYTCMGSGVSEMFTSLKQTNNKQKENNPANWRLVL